VLEVCLFFLLLHKIWDIAVCVYVCVYIIENQSSAFPRNMPKAHKRFVCSSQGRRVLPSSPGVGAFRVDWLAPIFSQWTSDVLVGDCCKSHRCERTADEDDGEIRSAREVSYFFIVTMSRRLVAWPYFHRITRIIFHARERRTREKEKRHTCAKWFLVKSVANRDDVPRSVGEQGAGANAGVN